MDRLTQIVIALCIFCQLPLNSVALAEGTTPSETRPEPTQDPYAIDKALQRYSLEPSINTVIAIALRIMALSPERARKLSSRARDAGWVPGVRLTGRIGYGADRALRWSDDLQRTWSSDTSYTIAASLIFDLSRVIFANEEVSLLREERALINARNDVIRTVTHIYFERRRLQLERDILGIIDIEHRMRIAEAESLLNAYTQGEFSTRLRQSSSPKPALKK